jgi:DeoR/GlpR family transcriptional regulator of sugar metabolism
MTQSALDLTALPIERQRLIATRLAQGGRVLAAELAAEFGVSEHTIRRDLRDLADAGLCKRVYGGAVLLSPASNIALERATQHPDGKQALGEAGARLVRPGQCVFFDAGTTNLALAQALAPGVELTAVTNSPSIALVLMSQPSREVIVIGGRVNAHAGGATGACALDQLQQMRIDLCFLGACAIDAEEGITVFDSEDAAFKRAAIAASGQIAVAVTNEKLATAAHYRVASLADVDTLIVEAGADRARLDAIRRTGVEVVVAR